MKLMELMPEPPEPIDPIDQSDVSDENSVGPNADRAHRERGPRKQTPRKGSNVAKALQIRNLARMKAKAADPVASETPHQYNLGSFQPFLTRGGPG